MRPESRFPYGLSVTLLCALALARQGGTTAAHVDGFVGRWRLNVARSSPTRRAETITIKPEGKRYRITQEFTDLDGNRSGDWTLTDMTGSESPLMNTDLTTTDVLWRVNRDGADSFVILAVYHGPGVVFRSELHYTVSPDGMMLTRRTLGGPSKNDKTRLAVFDRVP